jgi:hypothetical protein
MPPKPGGGGRPTTQIMRVAAIKGDNSKVQTVLEQTLGGFARLDEPGRQVWEASLQLQLCCCRNDVAGFLKITADHPDWSTLESSLLQGKFKEAEDKIDEEGNSDVVSHGLLYLAAAKAGDQKIAEKHWQSMLDALAKGNRDERRAAGMGKDQKPVDASLLRRLTIRPEEKRVVLAAFAQHFPKQGKDLLTLARKLDFQHDATSLYLRKVLKDDGKETK